ncbi:elongation factor G [Oribacterium sp. HCP28S3_H8]|uniref:elongation factor G n=1 Tax=Oribacterium sp. HCP28S3_H8 TaxID=3438945 RepID=UPI003F8CB615
MKVYDTGNIRNVVLLGHGGAGKTTVAEALAYVTGTTTRMGSVPEGNTISDYDKEEIKRKFSISTSVIPVEYKGEKGEYKINILDTPGYFDFVGEVEEAVSVADAAIIVVNCKAGVEPGTVKAWELCEKFHIPRLFFATNMDDDHASYRQLVLDLEKRFGRSVAPFQLPIRENEKFVGFVNVVKMGGRRFTHLSDYEECEIPDYVQKNLGIARNALLEAVAETSDEFMEKYFSGEEFSVEEIQSALRASVKTCQMVPVLMGSGVNIQGFNVLLQVIEKYFPAPDEFETVGVDASTGERFTAKYNSEASLTAKVWKTIVDPFMGKYSLVKVCTGTLKPNSEAYNVNKEQSEKIGKVYILRGETPVEVPELRSGDIGAVAKLSVTTTGDTMALRNAPILYHGPQFSKPYTYMAYRAENKSDEDKLSTALARMMEEDKTLKTMGDPENRQSLIYGIGDQQLDVVSSMIRERYNVGIILEKPRFAYRETIRKTVKVQGKYKKQSGGHGQYGDVIMEFAPSGDLETPYVFEEKVFGGSVPKNYFPAVEKGIQECCKAGPLAGYPVVGIKATLLDGSYHPVDSSEQAFKTAASLAFKDGFMQAQPVLLEPIVSLKVTVPDSNTGDIMGDLTKRRGRVLGMESIHGGKQVISAEIPMSNLYGYNTDLRSMTGGAGEYEYEFARYEQAPGDIQKQIVEENAQNPQQ